MHVERASRRGHVAGVLRQYLLDVLPLQSLDRKWLRTELRVAGTLVAAEGGDNFVGIGRFRQVVGGAKFDGLDRGSHAGESRKHDDVYGGVALLKAFDQNKPGSAGYLQVHDREVMQPLLDDRERIPKLPRRFHFETPLCQRARQDFDKRRIVVHQQQRGAFRSPHAGATRSARGKVTRVQPPPPSRLNNATLPPRRSTVALARKRPMPRPGDFVLTGVRPACAEIPSLMPGPRSRTSMVNATALQDASISTT